MYTFKYLLSAISIILVGNFLLAQFADYGGFTNVENRQNIVKITHLGQFWPVDLVFGILGLRHD